MVVCFEVYGLRRNGLLGVGCLMGVVLFIFMCLLLGGSDEVDVDIVVVVVKVSEVVRW